MRHPLPFLVLSLIISTTSTGIYPVEASWFADRFSAQDWIQALSAFQSQGGNTIWQRGPLMMHEHHNDILRDPQMQWCYVGYESCVEYMQQQVNQTGATISGYMQYANQENYGADIMACPIDFTVNSSRIYWVLALRANGSWSSDYCKFGPGDSVVILFLHFDGIDSKEIMLNESQSRSMEVVLGLPQLPPRDSAPWDLAEKLMPATYEWIRRILVDYRVRYASFIKSGTLVGFYEPVEIWLANSPSDIFVAYGELNNLIKANTGLQFVLSPYVITNVKQGTYPLSVVQSAFKELVTATGVDVVAVQEGRGTGKLPLYFPHQVNELIVDNDPTLYQINKYLFDAPPNVTYSDQYSASTTEMFAALRQAADELVGNGTRVELWFNLEAFNYLRNAPCLPVDPQGSGMAEMLDRTDKSRLDRGLGMAAVFAQRIISFAWDSCYLCTNGGYASSVNDEIIADSNRPIVGAVSVNTTIVEVLGFHIVDTGVQSQFNVTWTATSGETRTALVDANLINPNYGNEHGRSYMLQQAILAAPYSTDLPQPGTVVIVNSVREGVAGTWPYEVIFMQ